MKRQLSMSFFEDELAGAKTNKKEFLEQIDRLIPWGEWEKRSSRTITKESAGTSLTTWN